MFGIQIEAIKYCKLRFQNVLLLNKNEVEKANIPKDWCLHWPMNNIAKYVYCTLGFEKLK